MKRIAFKTKKTIQTNKVLFGFLDHTFMHLNEEFNLYLKQDLYNKKKRMPDDIFRAEERTLLGLFSNAIVRTSKNYQTYQEYGIYDEGKGDFIGRADMFVLTPDFQILLEAKKWRSKTLEFSNRELSQLLADVWEQGLGYYDAEVKNLKEKPYLMTLVFDWYGLKDPEKDLGRIKSYEIDKDRDGINYYTAYQLDNNVLMVYGWIS